ncbi:MAG TPA: sulfotransferase [Thermoleophilaceae bacterium]
MSDQAIATAQDQTVVCVLGMHRSGTSLVARLLNLLGVNLGPEEHMIKPTSANPAGYWESRGVQQINDEILERFGGSWLAPPELPEGWERSPELADLRQQARELIRADFADSELLGFKDPRNCLTLPFWQSLLGPMRYVICLRNPVDVAASLESREDDTAPFEQGVELWLTYTRAALSATAGQPRGIMFYEDLMAEPEATVSTLAGLIGRLDPTEVDAALEVAMLEGLWHHRTATANVLDTPGLAFHVKAFYLALRQFLSGREDVDIDVIELFGSYASEAGRHLSELGSELEEARERARLLDGQLSERSAQIGRLERSYAEERRRRRRLEAELRSRDADEDDSSAGKRGRVARARYDRLVAAVHERASELIPSGATVLVASKGDDALLDLNGSAGRHFPAARDGSYAGYHPAGDTAAIAQLEASRARGADHLLLPATALWWLDHYAGLRRHLEDRYERLLSDDYCAIYRLSAQADDGGSAPLAVLKRAASSLRVRTGRDPSLLDWATGLGIASLLPDVAVFEPPDGGDTLPYVDGSVDIVALASADGARLAEARRVAGSAVITVDLDSAETEWVQGAAPGSGEDVNVILLPDADQRAWEASRAAFEETLGQGFAGELSVVGADAGSSLAERARSAAAATGHGVQVFVTTPAIPLDGWLPPILTLLARNVDVGVIGARTVSGQGILQEAGGILAPGDLPQRRGEGDHDPDRPEYSFVKRVDFCSPPMFATRREVFERLGGFDARGATADEAVVDFSLRAGRTGGHVYYQPHACVVAIGADGG